MVGRATRTCERRERGYSARRGDSGLRCAARAARATPAADRTEPATLLPDSVHAPPRAQPLPELRLSPAVRGTGPHLRRRQERACVARSRRAAARPGGYLWESSAERLPGGQTIRPVR